MTARAELVLLPWIASASFAAACVAAVHVVSELSGVRAQLARHVSALERDLRYQGFGVTGQGLARAQRVAIASCALLALAAGTPWPLSLAAACALLPSAWLSRLRSRRTTRIDQQLDGWMMALAHALHATPALGDALESSAEVVAAPLAEELRIALREHALGSPLQRALEAMAARVASPVVSVALVTLRVAHTSGGDVVRTLETSAAALRDMARLEGVVRTKTAEGRAQAVVISIIPGPMLWTIDWLTPDLMAPLWTTDLGHIVLACAGAMWLLSLLAARHIVRVDI